jgi:hypothetical protein
MKLILSHDIPHFRLSGFSFISVYMIQHFLSFKWKFSRYLPPNSVYAFHLCSACHSVLCHTTLFARYNLSCINLKIFRWFLYWNILTLQFYSVQKYSWTPRFQTRVIYYIWRLYPQFIILNNRKTQTKCHSPFTCRWREVHFPIFF